MRFTNQVVPIFICQTCSQLTAMLTMRKFGAVCIRLFLYTVQITRVLPSNVEPSSSKCTTIFIQLIARGSVLLEHIGSSVLLFIFAGLGCLRMIRNLI